MKVKHIPYKELIVRCKKKGKTVGRPSKYEIILSRILSHEAGKKSFKTAMRKMQEDLMIFGTGAIEVKQ